MSARDLLDLASQVQEEAALRLRPELDQWFTPRWVCEAIVEHHFRDLRAGHHVLEPSCGDGRFLQALPAEVDATGVEIDPALARAAAALSGRHVIASDFLKANIDRPVTHVVGNPPFKAETIHRFLQHIHPMLVEGGRCGLLLPAYFLQTSTKVEALSRQWSIEQQLMPRNIFPRLRLPLVFATFLKDRRRGLVGFFLYREAHDVAALPRDIREALQHTPGPGARAGSVWRRAVRAAFVRLGTSTASLERLYETVERPSENRYWREKVRQTLQVYPEFQRAGAGTWQVAA